MVRYHFAVCLALVASATLTAAEIPDLTYNGDVGKIIGRIDKDNGLLPDP